VCVCSHSTVTIHEHSFHQTLYTGRHYAGEELISFGSVGQRSDNIYIQAKVQKFNIARWGIFQTVYVFNVTELLQELFIGDGVTRQRKINKKLTSAKLAASSATYGPTLPPVAAIRASDAISSGRFTFT